jgi:hypothetical protein
MKRLLLAGAMLLAANSYSQAAYIYPCDGDICLDGQITEGDAARFAAATRGYGAGTFVKLGGPGGLAIEALDIGDIIHRRGFNTAVTYQFDYCASACAILFFSGYHNVIRRNSSLIFHQVYDSRTGPDQIAIDYLADRVVAWGNVTKWQIMTLLNSAGPDGGAPGTEEWARRLRFQFGYVPNLFGMWRSCAIKFCVALP